MWILVVSAAFAQCEQASLEDLHLRLEAAEAAFADRDRDGVLEHSQAAEHMLPCVEEPFTAPDAARYHRVEGLRFYLAADEDQAQAYFAAARFAQPDYKLPTSLVPAGHPAQQLYDGADSFTTATEAVAAPMGGLTFDGRSSLDRPATRPTIVQVLNEGGGVVVTALLEPGDPMPIYEQAPAVVVVEPPPEEPTLSADIVEQPAPTKEKNSSRRAVLAMSGAGLAAGGAMFAASGWAYDQYSACGADDDACRTKYENLNHGLIIAGGVTSGLSLTTGVVGVALTGEF